MIDPNTLFNILDKIGAFVEMKAKMLCPVDFGELKSSIQHRVEGNKVIIFTSVEYARDMEYGKPPEPLSENEKEDLKEWAKRHNYSPEGIIRKIEKKGIKAGTPEHPLQIGPDMAHKRGLSYRPFMRPALLQAIPDIKKIIKRELEG